MVATERVNRLRFALSFKLLIVIVVPDERLRSLLLRSYEQDFSEVIALDESSTPTKNEYIVNVGPSRSLLISKQN